jgi:phenylalanyl-tRNA synthetase beta chain
VQALLAPRLARFERAEHPALHPGRCASVHLAGQLIGHVGELHPRWRQAWGLSHAPVLFELDLQAVLQRPMPTLAALPRQLPVERDLAVVVAEGVTHEQLQQRARRSGGCAPAGRYFVRHLPAQARRRGCGGNVGG